MDQAKKGFLPVLQGVKLSKTQCPTTAEDRENMMQPEGFIDPKGANKVCKLQRSINGLVQASRSWNICFDELIKAYGFYRLLEKPVFTRK